MGRRMKQLVTGAIAVTYSVTGCGLNHNSMNANQTTPGHPKIVSQAGPTNQTGNNAIEPTPSQPVDAGFTPFQLSTNQLQQVQQALTNINVANTDEMKFYGASVMVPTEVPQGTEFNNVFSGGQAGYPMYMSFVFNTFTLTLLNQSPIFSDMKKVGTTQINGQTATWYTRPAQQQTLYFLEYAIGGTYISFTTALNNVSQSKLEKVADSLTTAGH
jgi:hypothetical protein